MKGVITMTTINYTIKDKDGMHARPAGMFVKLAQTFASEITIAKGEKKASAKKLFAVMGMGIKCGEEIVLSIDGEDEATAAAQLESFLNENL